MNEQTALDLIEQYFANEVTEAEYQSALDYFIGNPQTHPRLSLLYQTLLTTSPINCEECQVELPAFLDPLTRRVMNRIEQGQLLLHLTECGECAEEYLELRSFSSTQLEGIPVPRFKLPNSRPEL